MIKKKLLALLTFTSQGMETNQDINIDNQLQSQNISSIDSQLQKQNSRKTLYIVSGSVAAVAIAAGAIWWFTKKDKTTEEQQGQQGQ